MGDVVVTFRGQVLRFTHEDFARLGKVRDFGYPEIALSKEWRTFTGNRQLMVSHVMNVDGEETRFGGHNAYYGDKYGITQLFASSKELRQAAHQMGLPNGRRH